MQDDYVATEITTILIRDRDTVRVEVVGEIDVATAPQMLDTAMEAIEAGRPTILDMGGVTFLDAAGVSALVALHKRAVEAGVPFRITNTDHRPVALVLALTRAAEILPLD
jgi:anti-sigma B factor antagonist